MRLDPAELAARIRGGEGKDLEFKRGLPGDAKLARTLCAFGNTRGGLLLIGVGDKGDLVGAPHARATLARLRVVAAEWLVPSLEVQLGTLVLDGRRLVWCSVPVAPARPIAARTEAGLHEIVVRVGASNRRASGATLRSIRAQRAAGDQPDELQRSVLRWLAATKGETSVLAFARAHNVGRQRARRAFTQLELGGRVVGHGAGARRVFALP